MFVGSNDRTRSILICPRRGDKRRHAIADTSYHIGAWQMGPNNNLPSHPTKMYSTFFVNTSYFRKIYTPGLFCPSIHLLSMDSVKKTEAI